MVVLDAVNHIRPRRRTTSQLAGTARQENAAVFREINGILETDVHDAVERTPSPAVSSAHEGVSADQGLNHRRLVEFSGKEKIKPFKPRPPDAPDGTWRMQREKTSSCSEFRNASNVFFVRGVCHVLLTTRCTTNSSDRFLIHVAALEMHPLDTEDRIEELRNTQGSVTATSRLLKVLEHTDPGQRNHSAERTWSIVLRSV
jgi:succinate dehydrogenase / fumarate reductase iron-sulfur subunit